LSNCCRNRLVMVELHRVLCTALRHRAQIVHVLEHVRQRHHRVHDNRYTTCFLALDLATTGVQVTDDVTDVILRRYDLDLHDRLEQLSTGLLSTLTECCAGCDLKRENRGVNIMVGTVDKRCLDAEHREARKRTGRQNAFDTLLNAGDVFLRNRSTNDLALEYEILALWVRLEHDLDAGELTRTTGLLLVRVVDFRLAGDRLTVSNLRRTDVRFNLELTTHTVDDDVQVKLAHASDDRLAGFLVGLNAEGRILSGKAIKREAHLFLVSLGLRLDRDLNDRLRELHAL